MAPWAVSYTSKIDEGGQHEVRCVRPHGPRRDPARPALRRPAPTARSLRPRRPSRLSSRRASLDTARLRRLARAVPRGGSAAHQDIAFRTSGLSVAVLSPAAPDRGNLHARSDERRAPRARRRARRVAVRDQSLWPRLREYRGDLSRGLPAHSQGARIGRAHVRGKALPVPQRADDPAAGAAAASAAVVRDHDPGECGLAGGKRREHRHHCIASDRARHHRSVSRGARQAREGS